MGLQRAGRGERQEPGQDLPAAGQRDSRTPEARGALEGAAGGGASGGRRHHAARRAAGGRAGVRPAPRVLHEPRGGCQPGGWEPEGDQSQPGQEKRRWRTRCSERTQCLWIALQCVLLSWVENLTWWKSVYRSHLPAFLWGWILLEAKYVHLPVRSDIAFLWLQIHTTL